MSKLRFLTLRLALTVFSGLFLPASTNSPAVSTVPLGVFAKQNGYQVRYHAVGGWAELTKEKVTVRIFLAMPYLVAGDSVHYLREPARLGPNGEILLSPEITRLAGAILNTAGKSSPMPASSRAAVSSVSAAASSRPAVATALPAGRDGFQPVTAVVIDPGHGGKDPGGLGVNGIKEKDIVLAVARETGRLLAQEPGLKVYYTRLSDRFVTLKERTDQATVLIRKGMNPVFVSIHGNISLNRKTEGIEVYSLSDQASDDEALAVEMMENAGFSKSDVEKTEALAMIVGDLLKDGIRRQSEKLAALTASGMVKHTRAQLRGVKKANFFVLKYNSMPSVLVEVGFLSNPRESKLLMSREYRNKLAAGISEGVRSFIRQHRNSRGFTQ